MNARSIQESVHSLGNSANRDDKAQQILTRGIESTGRIAVTNVVRTCVGNGAGGASEIIPAHRPAVAELDLAVGVDQIPYGVTYANNGHFPPNQIPGVHF